MQKRKAKAGGSSSFAALKSLYGLKTPTQIKLRIIWLHLKALVETLHADSAKNRKLLQKFHAQFIACEAEENKKK
jgi:hypothetical protein